MIVWYLPMNNMRAWWWVVRHEKLGVPLISLGEDDALANITELSLMSLKSHNYDKWMIWLRWIQLIRFCTWICIVITTPSHIHCIIYLVWKHTSVYLQQDKYQLSAICFIRQMSVAIAIVITIRPWLIHPKHIGTSWVVSHSGYNSMSIPVETVLHWAAYTGHWCINIILYSENMRTCLQILAAR